MGKATREVSETSMGVSRKNAAYILDLLTPNQS